MNKKVEISQPYDYSESGSLGSASLMLLRQHDFPLEYGPEDKLVSADHDRCLMWDRAHAMLACNKHLGTGDMGIANFALNENVDKIMAFLIDILKASKAVNWTGFRVLLTINRSNGYPVFSLQLFSKGKNSRTKTYSGDIAPNVEKRESGKSCSLNLM